MCNEQPGKEGLKMYDFERLPGKFSVEHKQLKQTVRKFVRNVHIGDKM